MESDTKYIDELTNNALKNYTEEPISSWNSFNEKFGSQLKPNTNLIANLSLKKTLIAIVTVSIVSVATFYYKSNKEPIITKKVETVKNSRSDNNTKKVLKIKNVNSKEKIINTKKSSKIAKEKDVIIKVKIPIRKKIEVRKQVIIKDSTN